MSKIGGRSEEATSIASLLSKPVLLGTGGANLGFIIARIKTYAT